MQHLSRVWPAVDVISKQYLDDLGCLTRRNVGVDGCKAPSQKISATVHVSDRVNANAIGRPWSQFSGAQRILHQISSPPRWVRGRLIVSRVSIVTYTWRFQRALTGFLPLISTARKIICGAHSHGDADSSAASHRQFAKSHG